MDLKNLRPISWIVPIKNSLELLVPGCKYDVKDYPGNLLL
jgi:hypothetical protein